MSLPPSPVRSAIIEDIRRSIEWMQDALHERSAILFGQSQRADLWSLIERDAAEDAQELAELAATPEATDEAMEGEAIVRLDGLLLKVQSEAGLLSIRLDEVDRDAFVQRLISIGLPILRAGLSPVYAAAWKRIFGGTAPP